MLVDGPTRCGKSQYAKSALLDWKYSVVALDLKADLRFDTAGWRSLTNDIIDIRTNGSGNQYDPLLGKNTEQEFLSVASHLLYEPHEGELDIFTKRAMVMLAHLCLGARRAGEPPLPYVSRLVHMGLPAAAEQIYQLEPDGPYLATQILDMDYPSAKKKGFKDEFLQSAWSTLSTKMRFLLTDTIVRCFNGSSFTGEDLMCGKKPMSVYLHFPEQDLQAMAPFIRLLWVNLIRELITTYDARRGKGCRPVLFVLDEAGRIALPHLDEYASTVCGRRISFMVIVQALSQLEAIYGKAKTETILSNMRSQIYFPPASFGAANFLSDNLGPTSVWSHSMTQREGVEVSEGLSEHGVPLIPAHEVKRMDEEEVIGFFNGYRLPPFKVKRIDFNNIPLLKQRYRLPQPPIRSLPVLNQTPVGRDEQQGEDEPEGFINPDSPQQSADDLFDRQLLTSSLPNKKVPYGQKAHSAPRT